MTTFIGHIPDPTDPPPPLCERLDYLDDTMPSCVVQCVLPKGHDGRHAFLHEWTDPRDTIA